MGCWGRLLFSRLLRHAENTPAWRPPHSFFSSSSAAEGDGVVSFFGGGTEESPFYRRQLWCRRPPTLPPRGLVPNTCSLIGKVAVTPRRCDSRSGGSGAYTILEVKNPPWVRNGRAFSPFRILLMMWNELAEVSLKYLHPNDFIYVSGHLSSYEKVDGNGKKEIIHKVIVKDLNYVQQPARIEASQNHHMIDKDAPACSSGESVEENQDRLRLWQVFFANPYEWWDNRHGKLYQSSPDFKHKHTKECLFLSPNDPPWVKKQLDLYDLERAGRRQKNLDGAHCHISEFL